MCYISRRIFPCCGREYWYSNPVPQQCTGTPRCSSTDCIILRQFPTVLKSGRCYRCILGDMRKGIRTGVSDRVLREAQRLEDERNRRNGVKKEKSNGRKENGKGVKGGIVGKGSNKRKREDLDDDNEALGNESKRVTFMNERQAPVRVQKSPYSNDRQGLARSLGPESRPQTQHRPNKVQADQTSYLSRPQLRVNFNEILPNPSQNFEQQTFGFDNFGLPPDMTTDPNLLAIWNQENPDFALDPNLFTDVSIDPKLLMNWDDNGTVDPSLLENPNGGLFSEQDPTFDPQASLWLPTGGNQNSLNNLQFTGYTAIAAQVVPEDGGFKEVGVTVAHDQAPAPAPIPLEDPMQFPSDLGDVLEFTQWPEDPPVDNTGLSVADIDEQSRRELEHILFGPLE